jgi:hypothetical protein
MVPHNRYPNDAGRRSLIFLIDSGPGFLLTAIFSMGFCGFLSTAAFPRSGGTLVARASAAALFQFAVGWD